MANFKKNNEAMSAVIGVTLMVMTTVILVAIISVFVYQLGGNVSKNKYIVCVDVKRTSQTTFIVKTMSGTDIGLLTNTAAQPSYYATVASTTITANPGTYDARKIGSQLTFTAASLPSGVDVTVVANFTDGSRYIVWSSNLV